VLEYYSVAADREFWNEHRAGRVRVPGHMQLVVARRA
jgi:hypothetical protein